MIDNTVITIVDVVGGRFQRRTWLKKKRLKNCSELFIDQVLADWARSADRKPLVLRGARQTGKSSAVREFGSRFELVLEVNLERYEDLALVRACRSPADLLRALSARHNVRSFPERTLLFLDEIQESPEPIRWLRFFREDHPELYVVAAGSPLLTLPLVDVGRLEAPSIIDDF